MKSNNSHSLDSNILQQVTFEQDNLPTKATSHQNPQTFPIPTIQHPLSVWCAALSNLAPLVHRRVEGIPFHVRASQATPAVCIKKLTIGSALWIQIALVCVIVYMCSSRTSCVSLKPEAWSLKPLSFSSDTPAFVSCVTQAQLPASTSTINSHKFILIRPGLFICFCFLIEN